MHIYIGELERAIRQLETERRHFQLQEKKAVNELKKVAKEGNSKATKIIAKDIVRIRQHQDKFLDLIAKMRAISLQMTAMASTAQITESIQSTTRAMRSMNRSMNAPLLSQMLQDFARQTEMMNMGSEMMDETLEMAMDDEDVEGETDEVVNQVLDEIGIDFKESMLDAPSNKQTKQQANTVDEDDLTARLNNLGR